MIVCFVTRKVNLTACSLLLWGSREEESGVVMGIDKIISGGLGYLVLSVGRQFIVIVLQG